MTTRSATNSFFDLHITGFGYLNRIRQVTPKRGDAFWACDISALNGAADDVSYTRFDCRVSGREAESLVRRCQQASDMGKKVLIGFKLGDLWTDTFVYRSGKRQGETGVSLKARLLFVSWIKIDGDMVHQAPSRDADQRDTTSQQDPEQQQPNYSDPALVSEDHAIQAQQPIPAQGYAAAGAFDSPVN
ncbi:MAG: DUF3577 domain-containing protein [Halomonas sp.]|nr:STY4534 family ICE replication protein [Halomonas sp.]MCC5902741.1 DUF3577 domain-containing protein [Halomonas sp.]